MHLRQADALRTPVLEHDGVRFLVGDDLCRIRQRAVALEVAIEVQFSDFEWIVECALLSPLFRERDRSIRSEDDVDAALRAGGSLRIMQIPREARGRPYGADLWRFLKLVEQFVGSFGYQRAQQPLAPAADDQFVIVIRIGV